MISRTATILTVTFTLGICLFIFILTTMVLGIRLVRHRRLHQQVCENLNSQIQQRQKKLDSFATLLDTNNCGDSGTSVYDIVPSYERTYHRQVGAPSPLQKYTDKWVSNVQMQPPIPDDIAWLEHVLYQSPQLDHLLSIDRDLRLFSNPQQYTTAQIAMHLHSPNRQLMIRHIMTATLLRNTSIKGNPFRSLLPLEVGDIDGLYNLADAIRNGLDLGYRLSVHTYRFGFYRPLPQTRNSCREPYHELFETIFQPYFKSNSPKDVAERRTDLNEVFDASVSHGMECLGFLGEIDYQWDERTDSRFELAPAMTCSNGKGGVSKVLARSDWISSEWIQAGRLE